MAEGILVVVRPFAGHAPGELIENPAQIAAVLGGEHVHDVVRIAARTPIASHRQEG